MRMTKEQAKYYYDKIFIALYEWRLLLSENEIENDFRILRSLQSLSIDSMVKKMSLLDTQRKRETFTALIKRFYDHDLYPDLKPTTYEQELLDHILKFPKIGQYSVCIDDMNKVVEYEEKKKLYGKKIYRQKLFNRLKKKLKENFQVDFEASGNDSLEFNIDNKDYDYYHNLYINDKRIMLLCNHANLIGFPSGWVIHQEEDIDNTLNLISSFCQEFYEKAGQIFSELDLRVE
jgi:hypothetical protein